MRLPVPPIAAYLALLGWSSIPFVPTEPAILAAGSYAGSTTLSIFIVIAAGALGGFVSDLLKYAIGYYTGPAVLRRLGRRSRGRRTVDWVQSRLLRAGPAVLVPAQFVPLGAPTACLLCGALRLRLLPVIAATAVATTTWSACFALIGFLGGATTGDPILGLVPALAAALGIGALVKRRIPATPPPSASGTPR
ncbi:MAG TPA: VTT domain-containing protein [Pseudonocardiaceae bacterium]